MASWGRRRILQDESLREHFSPLHTCYLLRVINTLPQGPPTGVPSGTPSAENSAPS